MVSTRTRTWATITLGGGLLLALTSIDGFGLATSPGMVISGAVSVVLGLAIAVDLPRHALRPRGASGLARIRVRALW